MRIVSVPTKISEPALSLGQEGGYEFQTEGKEDPCDTRHPMDGFRCLKKIYGIYVIFKACVVY